jgi:hypothetical protein
LSPGRVIWRRKFRVASDALNNIERATRDLRKLGIF